MKLVQFIGKGFMGDFLSVFVHSFQIFI